MSFSVERSAKQNTQCTCTCIYTHAPGDSCRGRTPAANGRPPCIGISMPSINHRFPICHMPLSKPIALLCWWLFFLSRRSFNKKIIFIPNECKRVPFMYIIYEYTWIQNVHLVYISPKLSIVIGTGDTYSCRSWNLPSRFDSIDFFLRVFNRFKTFKFQKILIQRLNDNRVLKIATVHNKSKHKGRFFFSFVRAC